jgi:transcriptional regulator with XRE-family HTH domain
MPRVSSTRPRVDDTPLARALGVRLRQERLAAGLTQQQLADGRYTKAYVSALENGLSRPSMSALTFFAQRLGLPPSRLLNEKPPAWARLDADLALASGNWDEAIDAYRQLIESATGRETRAELLLGIAEALIRRGRGSESAAAASESAQVFHSLFREADAALAEYWLSAAQYQLGNTIEAKALLRAILARVREGMKVEPDFQLRLVMALASNESRDDNHSVALAYLEEVRALSEQMDDKRRAVYLHNLAYSYWGVGDFEAAVRAGTSSLALFRRVDAQREAAMLENDLALSYLAMGNSTRASEMAASARSTLDRLQDDWHLAHVLETHARIALASGEFGEAVEAAMRAVEAAEACGNLKAAVNANLTLGRAHVGRGESAMGLAAFGRAGGLAREIRIPGLLRETLKDWADALALSGRHEEAFALMSEALEAR